MYVTSNTVVHHLPSGLSVLTCRLPYARTANVVLWFRRGQTGDPPGQSGLTHLLEHLLVRGEVAVLGDFAQWVEEQGGQIEGAVYQDYGRVNITLEAGALGAGLAAMAALLGRGPALAYFDSEQRALLEEINEFCDLPENRVTSAVADLLPPGRYTTGNSQEVAALTAADVERYWRTIAMDELLVVVTGPAAHAEMAALAADAFAGVRAPGAGARPAPVLRTAAPAPGPAPAASPAPVLVMPCSRDNRAYLALGFRLPSLTLDEFFAMHTCDALLCKGMAARLFRALRDRGLIYDLTSEFDFGTSAHRFYVTTATSTRNLVRVLSIIMDEIRAVRAGAVTEAEWVRAARYTRGQSTIFLEDTCQLAKFLGLTYLTYGVVPPPDCLEHLGTPATRERSARLLEHMCLPAERAAVVLTASRDRQLAGRLAACIAN